MAPSGLRLEEYRGTPAPAALRPEEYREPAMPPELQRAEYRGPATPLALRLEEYRDLSMYLLELMMCWLPGARRNAPFPQIRC